MSTNMQPPRPPDTEWIAFDAGIKPALRVTVDPARAAEVATRFRSKGLAVVDAERLALLPGRPAQAVFYVARSMEHAEATRAAEAPILPGGPSQSPNAEMLASHRELGRRLGYPPCCVDAFVERLQRGVTKRQNGLFGHEDFVAAEDAFLKSSAFFGRLNHLLFERQIKLIPCYPCRYDCPVGLDYAAAVFEATKRATPAGAALLLESLCTTLEIAPDGRRATVPGQISGEFLSLDFRTF
jgi:hypothetical protein